MRDEERQFARARRLLRREAQHGQPIFVGQLVLLETERMLRSGYGLSKADILGAFSALFTDIAGKGHGVESGPAHCGIREQRIDLVGFSAHR